MQQDRRLPLAWLVAITLAAAALRLRGVGEQILADDETHLLTVVTSRSLGQIPSTVFGLDFSIPLALLFRAWSAWTPLTEWMLRAPLLIAGSLTPALLAIVARRFVPGGVALLAGMLAAVHPLLIFYSRYVRPYGLCLPLLLLVLWLLDRWSEEPRRRRLGAAALLAALACWLQPLAVIPVALLYLGLLVSEARTGAPARRVGLVVAGGLAALALTLLLFAPALVALVQRMVLEKVARGALTAPSVTSNASVLAGLPGLLPAVLGWTLVAAGAVLLARRLGARAPLLIIPALGQPLIIALLRPDGLEASLVLARYQLYALPLYLFFAAATLGAGAAQLARLLPARLAARLTSLRAAAFGAALLAGAWLLLGPVFAIYSSPRGFAHHNVFQTYRFLGDDAFRAAARRAPDAPVHPLYVSLAEAGDVPLVVEWPPTLEFPLNYTYLSQAFHRRPIALLASPAESWFVNERLALRNVLDLSRRGEWRLAPGTTLILHRNPMIEQARYLLRRPDWRPPPPQLRASFDITRSALVETFGAPVFEDALITAFRVPPRGG